MDSRRLYVWASLFGLPLAAVLIVISLPFFLFSIGAAYCIAWMLYLRMAQTDAKFNLPLNPSRVYKANVAFIQLLVGWITDMPLIVTYLQWRWHVRKDFSQLIKRDIQYSKVHPSCRLDAYRPNRDRAPIVVFIYGGSWSSGSKFIYTPLANTLRELGCAVVVPDYRKYPLVKVGPMYDDVRSSIQWAYDHAEEFNGDRDNIFVMGHSAGAHLTMQTILSDLINKVQKDGSDRPALPVIQGIILLAGVYSIERHLAFETKRGVDKLSAMSRAMGSSSEGYAENSPYNLVQEHEELFATSSTLLQSLPKILFIHGDADTTVPREQSVDMYNMFGQVLSPERREQVDIRIRLHKRLKHAQCVTALMPNKFGQDRLFKSLRGDIQEFVGLSSSDSH
ncbi:hypothetical protein LRAMOSA07506 [Lichtheimia ramosa]|uniref:BD-FAE-like domain-containing protein n=1 Tax=Lichtheimia ramosa TaxID=688394 RepID=A0A077WBA1_9FUNG|nr:hypothetical protein LRAMOSA07506 [Lichtheimia ramosa]